MWGGHIFERNITTLENAPTPLFEEPLKFIAHGCIFKMGYIATWASEQLGVLFVAYRVIDCPEGNRL